MRVSGRVFRVLAIIAAAVGLSAVAGAASAAPPPSASYVSLGDSLAFGYQPNLVAANDFDPSHYRGYPEDYAAMRPHLQLANFGCPGETTDTLINGGCPWLLGGLPLHMPYPGGASQLDAAVAYLLAHPATELISVDVGSNDLLAVVGACNADIACIQAALPAALASLAANYALILGTLHAAAPQAQVVAFNLYDPIAETLPGSDQLLAAVNQVLETIAAASGATVADAFSAMNHAAGSPAERAFICSRTWECSPFANIHPTDLGYRQMAVALLHAVQP